MPPRGEPGGCAPRKNKFCFVGGHPPLPPGRGTPSPCTPSSSLMGVEGPSLPPGGMGVSPKRGSRGQSPLAGGLGDAPPKIGGCRGAKPPCRGVAGGIPPPFLKGVKQGASGPLLQPGPEWDPEPRQTRSQRGWGKKPGGVGGVPPEKPIKGARRQLLQPGHEGDPEPGRIPSQRGWGKNQGAKPLGVGKNMAWLKGVKGCEK